MTDTWFAWFPVRCGALGTGEWAWFEKVWRNRCAGVTIYQPIGEPRLGDAHPCSCNERSTSYCEACLTIIGAKSSQPLVFNKIPNSLVKKTPSEQQKEAA